MQMQLGVIGLGTMGANLARNAARNGAKVAIFNRTTEKTDALIRDHGKDGNMIPVKSFAELAASLESPRPILLMVKAGEAVDAMIAELLPHLSPGDIIIDAGNSHWRDTERRQKELKEKNIHFIGMGVSGGEEGALNGPSMMPGGDKAAYDVLSPLLQKMAADDGQGGKCVTYVGPGGTGHFVKMVHNGIEYGVMQLIAEAYHLLKDLGKYPNTRIAEIFSAWSKSDELRGFLMEITAHVFKEKDPETGKDLIDVIKDSAGQKGTGKWTTDAAMQYGVAVPTITAAVDARIMSSAKDFRVAQSVSPPLVAGDVDVDQTELLSLVRTALELGLMNAYGQGFQLLSVPSQEEKWNLNISDIARIWRGGCIIRSGILEQYQVAFTGDQKMAAQMRARFDGEKQIAWRHVIALGALRGIPLPAMSASLSYYDSYRTARLPQNLIQAQRDFFGAHTFERLDKPGPFHTHWKSS